MFPGDTGALPFAARSALVQLVKGPLVTASSQANIWSAVLAYEEALRSRLADMFLILVVDSEAGVAFTRGASSEDSAIPSVLRTTPLTLIDTALVLFLRERLLQGEGSGRVFIGLSDIMDQLLAYRASVETNEAGFRKKVMAAVAKMLKPSVLQKTLEEERFEISPILRLIFSTDEVRAVATELQRLIDSGGRDASDEAEDLTDNLSQDEDD